MQTKPIQNTLIKYSTIYVHREIKLKYFINALWVLERAVAYLEFYQMGEYTFANI
jgi:hypothetical protein